MSCNNTKNNSNKMSASENSKTAKSSENENAQTKKTSKGGCGCGSNR